MNFKVDNTNNTMANSSSNEKTQPQPENELSHLLAQCKLGDKNAFALLYKKTSTQLNGIAYRITRNVDSAAEVLQEAFIQIWKNRSEYHAHKSEPFTWLASIVRYRAYDRLRYDKRRHQQSTVEFNETDITNKHIDDIEQYAECLNFACSTENALSDCLGKLEQKQSQSILMAYLYGYSREEISSYFSTPMNTIKSWIRRGLGKLQLCLSN